MGFEIIFNEECAKIKNNSVTLGGLTCCLAEGDWDMFFQVGLGEYLSEEIQLFAKQFLDICYDNKKFSSPSSAYVSFIIENGLMKSNYAVLYTQDGKSPTHIVNLKKSKLKFLENILKIIRMI